MRRAAYTAPILVAAHAFTEGRAALRVFSVRARFVAPALRSRALMLAVLFLLIGARTVFAALSVEQGTFNVIGLDSNNVNAGPNIYPTGVRVCNTGGTTVTNLTGTFVWDSSNAFINLTGLNPVVQTSLAAGQCTHLFFDVVVTRSTSSYNQVRRYHINVTADGEPTYSTPTPRELYVEKLVSQNRNSTLSVNGPSTVIVGQTYTYVVNAKTATGGYEQLESFLYFPNTMFQVLSISTTYSAPTGGTNNKLYADACGWENNPTSPNYRSCVGPVNYSGGKAGGDLVTTYTVRVIGSGSFTANSMIYDFSGSSYHYGNDLSFLSGTAQTPPNVPLVKSVSPSGSQPPGIDLTYTIAFSNSGSLAAQQFIITDPIPTSTDFKVGSVTTTLGGLSSVTVAYSNNGGASYAYTPVSGGGSAPAGYDRNITHVRWSFTGSLASASAGNVTFAVRIQ